MQTSWFEIVLTGYGRYSWILVVLRDNRRRVIARSERDYRSRKRVLSAIERLRAVVPDADVVDTGYPLPATSFEYVPGVLPLVVGGSTVKYGAADGRRRNGRRAARKGSSVAQQAAADQAARKTAAKKTAAKKSASGGSVRKRDRRGAST